MKMRNEFVKKICGLTVLTLVLSSIGPVASSADFSSPEPQAPLENILASETIEGITVDVDLNEEVLAEDFDLEEEVANMPTIDEMTPEQKVLFEEIVTEQVALAGIEETEIFEQAITDFFDDGSATYNDLNNGQAELEEAIEEAIVVETENEVSMMKKGFNGILGVTEAQAAITVKGKVKVGVKFAGAVFNTAIGFAVGGGVGAIQAFIIKKGKEEAQKLFTRTVTSRLKAWGAKKLAISVGVCVTVALNYLDIGTQIAKQLDKRDKVPNNGWVNIY